jgi:hypothetical protein
MSSVHSESLDDLSTKFEGLLERLQTTVVRKGMETAFNANPAALGRAAVKVVRQRRKARPQPS